MKKAVCNFFLMTLAMNVIFQQIFIASAYAEGAKRFIRYEIGEAQESLKTVMYNTLISTIEIEDVRVGSSIYGHARISGRLGFWLYTNTKNEIIGISITSLKTLSAKLEDEPGCLDMRVDYDISYDFLKTNKIKISLSVMNLLEIDASKFDKKNGGELVVKVIKNANLLSRKHKFVFKIQPNPSSSDGKPNWSMSIKDFDLQLPIETPVDTKGKPLRLVPELVFLKSENGLQDPLARWSNIEDHYRETQEYKSDGFILSSMQRGEETIKKGITNQ
jgi:hypothetical protein